MALKGAIVGSAIDGVCGENATAKAIVVVDLPAYMAVFCVDGCKGAVLIATKVKGALVNDGVAFVPAAVIG